MSNIRKYDDPAWQRAAGNLLSQTLTAVAEANNVDASGHTALQAKVPVPAPDAPTKPMGPSTLSPKLQALVDKRVQESIDSAVGPAIEKAVEAALAKLGGDGK